jgi:hypothetical protein
MAYVIGNKLYIFEDGDRLKISAKQKNKKHKAKKTFS